MRLRHLLNDERGFGPLFVLGVLALGGVLAASGSIYDWIFG